MESVLWASEVFNRSATTANSGVFFPHEVFFRGRTPMEAIASRLWTRRREESSRDVTWHQPREPLISPAPTVGSRTPYLLSDAETPDYVYIQSTPAATATPAAAPATAASVPASAVTAPAPLPNPPASISDRVVRELGHEADVRSILERTQGETRAQ